MASSFISQLLLIICCSPLITAQCVHQYKVVEATKNGPGLCGLDDPHSRHGGSPLPVCSSRCTVDINCLFFNLKTPLNQDPVCELYHSPPQNTAVESDCLLFAVRRHALPFSLLWYVIAVVRLNVLVYVITHRISVRSHLCLRTARMFVFQLMSFMPTHRRRRRDETVLSRRRCEYNSQLAHDDCRRIRSTIWKLTKQTP